LIFRKELSFYKPFFEIENFEMIIKKDKGNTLSQASVNIKVN
jgi:hypothetical protein